MSLASTGVVILLYLVQIILTNLLLKNKQYRKMSIMEQQMDDQIQGGIHEREWCYARIKELESQNAELTKKLLQVQRFRMEDATDAQGDQLMLAEAVKKLKSQNAKMLETD